jgi:23S rRNA pseudouridine1911/1915/1917 synthase
MQAGTVVKRYWLLVVGKLTTPEGVIDVPIGRDPKNRQRMAVIRSGRPAVTHLEVVERFEDATLLRITIETGRTHQIRVHLAFIGHPVLGDAVYGDSPSDVPGLERQFLHASELAFSLPNGDEARFSAPLPEDLARVLAALRARTASEE